MEGFYQAFLAWISSHTGLALGAVFFTAFIESIPVIGLVIPGIVLMVAYGAMVAADVLPFWSALLAAATGAFAGDCLAYYLGYHYRSSITSLWQVRNHPELIPAGENYFHKYGTTSLFFGRFFGPTRGIVPLVGGILRTPGQTFILIELACCICWATAYMLPGLLAGKTMGEGSDLASMAILLLVLIALLGWAVSHAMRFSIRILERLSGDQSNIPHQLLLCLSLSILTLFSLNNPDLIWKNADTSVLTNSGFTDLQDWQVSHGERDRVQVDDGILTLNNDFDQHLHVWQDFRKHPLPLRVSADIRTTDVVAGSRVWNEARIIVVGLDASNNILYGNGHTLIQLSGTQDWQSRSAVFMPVEAAVKTRIAIQMPRATGQMEVRNLQVNAVQRPWYYPAMFYSMMVFWLTAGIWLLFQWWQGWLARQKRILIVLLTIMLAAIMMPLQVKDWIDLYLLQHIPYRLPIEITTLSHIVGFAVFSLFLGLGCDSVRRVKTLLAQLFMLAILTEAMQSFIPVRTPEAGDMLSNFSGVALGLTAAFMLTRLSRKRHD